MIEMDNIFQEAVKVFGEDAQWDMVIEECSELIKAIQKMKRNKKSGGISYKISVEEVMEELADVLIMVDQGIIMAGEHKFDTVLAGKMLKLKLLLDSKKSNNLTDGLKTKHKKTNKSINIEEMIANAINERI